MSANVDLNNRPDYDKVIQDIADYVLYYKIESKEALSTARNCLMDTLGCGLLALRFPECTKLLGPLVEGTLVPNGARVPGNLGLGAIASQIGEFELLDQGANISGGEAKRLSLLRLILKPGSFNLFDEPIASLDPATSEQVWNCLFQRFADRAMVCVTHDFKALPRFDRVLVLRNGGLAAKGTWTGLLDAPDVASVLQAIEEQAS